MTCRAPSSSVTCAGTPTGAVLTYDNERRLATWQNTPSNPTSTASYWYDGEGQRVAQTLNGTTTYYIGSDEEITGSTLLKYYHIPGLPVLGTITGVTRTYLASDGLGSETVDLSYNGSVLAQALYGPYGVGRYSTGTMPTSRGYTGQRQDSGSGLDYYGARYYDAAAGQFTCADTLPDVNPIVFGGDPEVAKQLLKGAGAQSLNRFGYVMGNPESMTDPTGHRLSCGPDCQTNGTDGCNGMPDCSTLPACDSLISCTGLQNYEAGPGLPCGAKVCFLGHDSHGLLHFLRKNYGKDSAGVVIRGSQGVEWLLNELEGSNDQVRGPGLRGRVNDAFDHSGDGGNILASIVTGLAVPAPEVFGIPAAILVTHAGSEDIFLGHEKGQFNDNLDNLESQLTELDAYLATQKDPNAFEFVISDQGGNWQSESLGISAAFYDTTSSG